VIRAGRIGAIAAQHECAIYAGLLRQASQQLIKCAAVLDVSRHDVWDGYQAKVANLATDLNLPVRSITR
jgi:hypothetical protein